jgi:histidinol-phosphatase
MRFSLPDRSRQSLGSTLVSGSSAPTYSDDLALALELADRADALTLQRFLALDLVVETKPDLTPVSDADRAVERLVRDHLAQVRPADAVHGEEYGGGGAPDVGRVWVIDPIDGTKNFVRGVPVWATLLALLVDGLPRVGVVSAPALGRRWWASPGEGAWAGGALVATRRIAVSGVTQIADASVSGSDHDEWSAVGLGAGYAGLLDQAWRTRAYGDFWSHLLVAEGAVDIALEAELALWDVAALVPVVREAGGRITGRDGDPCTGPTGAVTTNGHLHDATLGLLNGPP